MVKKCLLIVMVFLILSLSVYAFPSPTNEFYINDFAGVIDESVEKHIVNISAQIKNKTGAQIVVVTVESLDGMSAEEYALKLGREWGIGNSEKDNGFLMLISTGDRELRFEVGYGLEGALPDGKCGRIQDEFMMSYLSENNYSEAVLKGYDVIVAEVCNEYSIEIPSEVDALPLEDEELDAASVITTIIMLVILIFIITKTPPSSRRNRHIFFGGYSGFGGGGFRGGSSGGFSGGGGSFGGGGSSRKF